MNILTFMNDRAARKVACGVMVWAFGMLDVSRAQTSLAYDFESVAAAGPTVEAMLTTNGCLFDSPLFYPLGWKFNSWYGLQKEYHLLSQVGQSHSGQHSIFVRGHMQGETFFDLDNGRSIDVGFWARQGAPGAKVVGSFYLYDASYGFLGEYQLEGDADVEWSEHRMKFVIPEETVGGTPIRHACFALGSEIGAYFDDVSIRVNMATVLAANWTVPAQGTESLTFGLDEFAGKQVRLLLDGRIDWGGLGGNTVAMTISVNGQPLIGRRLMNKPLTFTMREGTPLPWAERNANHYRLMYSADFSDRLQTDEAYPYGLPEANQHPFHFMWDITPFVLPGVNTITVSSPLGMALVLKFRDVLVEVGDPIAYPDPSGGGQVTPAPTGPLPVFMPKAAPALPLTAELSSLGNIRFSTSEGLMGISSRTSLPAGAWKDTGGSGEIWQALAAGTPQTVTWSCTGYDVERRVALHEGRIAIRDTILNTGSGVLGVMMENRLSLPAAADKTLLAGREAAWVSELKSPFHPTAMASLGQVTVGMVAENDLFRVHAVSFRESQIIGLADRSLGIPPGESRVLEWSLYLMPDGDYWDVVNAIRRDWESNFPLQGPVAFTGSFGEWGYQWYGGALTVGTLQAWLLDRNNALPMIMTHVATNPNIAPANATKENPFWYHGTAIPYATLWRDNIRGLIQVMALADPAVKVFAYLHPNLSTEVGYDQMYLDSIALNRDGSRARSIYTPEPGLFIPTLGNSYGTTLTEVYQDHIDDLGANLYIDELTVAIPPEAPYPVWDGCTVEINPATHSVVRTLSSSTLLMQPWLDAMITYAKTHGKTAFANTSPPTRTIANWKIQHITEDTGPAGITSMHLSTPLAWTYDTGEANGYQHIRESLSLGAISFSRSGAWSDLMFPLTPIELHEDLIIGEERILTNHSGKFGWGDASSAEVYVFDGEGQPVLNPDVQEVTEGALIFTEIRMPSDHFAILVRVED